MKKLILRFLFSWTALSLALHAAPIPLDLPRPDGQPGNSKKPVKVYMLAGQSNMVGFAGIDPGPPLSNVYLSADPAIIPGRYSFGHPSNVMVPSFMPGSFKGILFLASPSIVEADQGALFGEQMSVLANSWKSKFACEDPEFIYTIPSKTLAPKIAAPTGIKGKARAIEINAWDSAADVIEAAVGTYGGRSDK